MSPEELYECSSDMLLSVMRASVCEVREIIRHTLAVIEQSRIIVREVDDRWHTLAAAWNPSNLA